MLLKLDLQFNRIGRLALLKSLLIPDAFNAVIWLRLYGWLERHRLPTCIAYRWLYHLHGLEMAHNVEIGGGLRLPHPRGVLFTAGVKIGERVSIYGNVRFTRTFDHAPRIGSDVLIGDSVIFTGRAAVGDHTVVGAGAVVTKEFPGDVVIAGNPARILHEGAPPDELI